MDPGFFALQHLVALRDKRVGDLSDLVGGRM